MTSPIINPNAVHLGSLRGEPSLTPRMTTVGVLPASKAAASQISKVFAYQSFCDTDSEWRAVLPQSPSEPIVASTRESVQTSGFGVALHPDSQTPVAIRFIGAGRDAGSGVYILKPGQQIRPTGVLVDGRPGFSGFEWGLPFGWLGGGLATIIVLQTPDAAVDWPASTPTEIIFHRQRLTVLGSGDLYNVISTVPATWANNWPMRFPSPLTVRYDVNLDVEYPQGGNPQIAISHASRVVMRLPKLLTTATSMRALFYFIDGLGNPGTTGAADVTAVDVTWPALTSYPLPTGYRQNTVILAPELFTAFACEGLPTAAANRGPAGMLLVSDDPELRFQPVDIIRYGYL